MTEKQDKGAEIIDPGIEANYWAERGVPDAAEFFAQRAGWDHIKVDKLLLDAYTQQTAILSDVVNIQSKIKFSPGARTVNMYDDNERELRDAVSRVGQGRGQEGNADEYLQYSLVATKRQVETLTRLSELERQASARKADFLKQSLKKQEVPLPYIPPTH